MGKIFLNILVCVLVLVACNPGYIKANETNGSIFKIEKQPIVEHKLVVNNKYINEGKSSKNSNNKIYDSLKIQRQIRAKNLLDIFDQGNNLRSEEIVFLDDFVTQYLLQCCNDLNEIKTEFKNAGFDIIIQNKNNNLYFIAQKKAGVITPAWYLSYIYALEGTFYKAESIVKDFYPAL